MPFSVCSKNNWINVNNVIINNSEIRQGEKIKHNNKKDKRIKQYASPKSSKRAYLPALATVEAALVIPIFIYAVMTVGYMLQIVGMKSRISQALYNDARQLSRYAYMYNAQDIDNVSGLLNYSVASGIMVKELGTDFANDNNIVGGTAGLIMSDSKILDGNNRISLSVSYTVKNPLDIFGLNLVHMNQAYVTAAWLGEDGEEGYDIYNKDRVVYVTLGGEVYHEDRHCTYLDPVIMAVDESGIASRRNESGGIYYPCKECHAIQLAGEVYITQYGDRYHVSRDCSSLKRVVMELPLSKVGNRRACSKCGGSHG